MLTISEQFLKEESSPERLLLGMLKYWRWLSEPIDLGIVPERLLFDMSINSKKGKFFQNKGTWPENLLLEITKIVSLVRSPMDKGMILFRELKEMF